MTFKGRELLGYCTIFGLMALVGISAAFAQNNSLSQAERVDLNNKVAASLRKGVAFFQTINTQGGYVYFVTPDLSLKWGEVPLDDQTIEVQPPGTPAVGQSFLRAYRATGDKKALEFAKEAAYALIRGQNINGGWDHTINFQKLDNDKVSFDDNQTQSAVSFLMALDQELEDSLINAATQRALKMMMHTQLSNGGWPHKYPEQGNYHDYATFNDGGINDCIRVMMEAYQYYPNDEAIEKSLRKAARFMNISQLPPPQPGWAQQYNEFLQPAWARTFEPAAVCPSVTLNNINTLIDLYLVFGNATILEPIPDALRWLREIRMENGKWARFVELGTNKPLYYDRPRIRVDNIEDLHPERRTGYGYQSNLQSLLKKSTLRYEKALKVGNEELWKAENLLVSKEEISMRLNEITSKVKKIIKEQEKSGAWVTKNDKFKKTMPRGERWNGQYLTMDRISSAVFNENIATLSEYISLGKQLDKF
ncbi:pectate lyase [uncultured Cyclobacterium sp.]|mgnify:CR=1 FL=1|uniref:pectate lyase n=1 Tax=uncultured Cyclobacterium sp. TaxID=453820 RepID=UPI0030EF0821|tara:strand:+ start:87290 stop:88723 length:1434 start_codon:yes stop_codon:yes gene_type:complete